MEMTGVAETLAQNAVAAPVNEIVDVAGRDREPFATIIRRYLASVDDARAGITDQDARGGRVEEQSLVPLGEARIRRASLAPWALTLRSRNVCATTDLCHSDDGRQEAFP